MQVKGYTKIEVINTEFGLVAKESNGNVFGIPNIDLTLHELEIIKVYGHLEFKIDEKPLSYLELWVKDYISQYSQVVKYFKLFYDDGVIRFGCRIDSVPGGVDYVGNLPADVIFTSQEVANLIEYGQLNVFIERVQNV